jgi:hypothetical protein
MAHGTPHSPVFGADSVKSLGLNSQVLQLLGNMFKTVLAMFQIDIDSVLKELHSILSKLD